VLGTSAAVQSAITASPTVTSAIAATVSPGSSALAGGESVTSPGDGGMEFTLDAATLEQLRGAGDASALMETSTAAAAAAGFGEAGSDDQSTMQVDGCADDWVSLGLVQLDGPMDSEDIVDDVGDEDAGAELEGDGEDEQEQADGGDGADGGFDADDLDNAADGSGDVDSDAAAAFVSAAADELSAAAAASSGFTAAELSSHAAALDADDPAAAYMMQVSVHNCHVASFTLLHGLSFDMSA